MEKHVAERIPKLQGKLRSLVVALAENSSALKARAFNALLEHEETYAGLPAFILEDVRRDVSISVDGWFQAVLSGLYLSEDELRLIEDTGRRRVHQGVDLPSLLRTFRIISLELWRSLLDLAEKDSEVRDELLFDVSPYIHRHFDRIAKRVANAFLEEQLHGECWRDALAHELVTTIFTPPYDEMAFVRLCEKLSIEPTELRVALALEVRRSEVISSRVTAERKNLVRSIARHLRLNGDDLIYIEHQGRLVLWVPTLRGDSILSIDIQMRASTSDLVAAIPAVSAIGVGLANRGAHGWASSMDEAFKVLDYGLKSGVGENCFFYSDLAVSESVPKDESALRYINSLAERLSHEPELLTTLAAYFAHRLHRRHTAAALGIHPNTLSYRLERIEAILDAKLDDISWIAKLHVVMSLRRHKFLATD